MNILLRWNVQSRVVEKDNQATGRDIWRTDKVFSPSYSFKIWQHQEMHSPSNNPVEGGAKDHVTPMRESVHSNPLYRLYSP